MRIRARTNSKPRAIPTPKEIANRNKRLAAAVNDGVSWALIRERFGMGEESAKRILTDMGVSWPTVGRPYQRPDRKD